jgi:hypothetical protein
MTEEQYYAELKKLGFKINEKSGNSLVCSTRDNEPRLVPAPEFQTSEQREETISLYKQIHQID